MTISKIFATVVAMSMLAMPMFNTAYADSEKLTSNNASSNQNNTRLVSASPGVTWKVTDDLSLSASYQFRYKTIKSSGSATDNAAFITLRYALPNLHWSGF